MKPAEKTAIPSWPNCWSASPPPTAAPTVCAKVFSVRIAEIGSSIRRCIRWRYSPLRLPVSLSSSTWE